MAFNGNEGEQISLSEGAELTKRYRERHPNSGKGVFYGRTRIEAILAQPGCMGIRMYFANEADGSQTVVLVGADSSENDMLNVVVEVGHRCPPYCSSPNSLNDNLVQK